MAFDITCIHSALDDLKLLANLPIYWNNDSMLGQIHILVYRMTALRLFLLCTRKLLGNDMHLRSDDNNQENENLGSLLVRIEDAVSLVAQEVRSYRLRAESKDGFPSKNGLRELISVLRSFEKEINERYISLSDYLRQSSSPNTDEVMEIIHSVLENLWEDSKSMGRTAEILIEKLSFFKNFIRFSTLGGIERPQLEDLLFHIQAVVVNTSHILYMWQFSGGASHNWYMSQFADEDEELEAKILVLLEKIKSIDPQVCQTYIQALNSSKVSRQLNSPSTGMDNDSIIIMKDFVDSLVCNLWEMLQLDICLVVSLKDQLQVLYEGLRFLRTSLKEQPNKFVEKIWDLTAIVVCDAGVVIFSLFQKDVEIDLGLLELIERMKLIRTEVEGKIPETSTFNFPRTNELGFIDSLLENLMELTSSKAKPNFQSHAEAIQEDLVFLRSFLWEIVELRNQDKELQALWSRIVEVAYRVEFLIDLLVVGDIPHSFSSSFDSVREDFRNIKKDVLKFFDSKNLNIKVQRVTRTSSRVPSQSIVPITDEVVGFDDDATSIMDRLTRGSKQLRIVAIVGMPGLGKTTLATKIYNDLSVIRHFHVRAWSSISQVYNQKRVLLELLRHNLTKLPDGYVEKTEQDLAEELWRSLKGRRYLIFLDDVWDIEVWNSLQGSLPDDANGSRIILTSRLRDVAPQTMLDEEPHFLRQLNNAESWELLEKKIFPGNSCPPGKLHELGMQIAESCKGLPLTIVLVAGLLATAELDVWEEILESLSSGIISSTEQCMNTLELSYKHLPDYLKPCFLYFGVFPEDQELSVKTLIRLWIAEGFAQKTKLKRLEDIATDYMMDLIGRSLVIVAKTRSTGGVRACRIHDLLHDFCVTKAKEENFFRLLKGYDELLAFNEPYNTRRLCIHSNPNHFKDSKLFCPGVRSLLFFYESEWNSQKLLDMSFIIHIFRLLRVLDLRKFDLGLVFPSEIQLLVQLTYLAVQGEMEVIPPSIGNLINLETFIVNLRGIGLSLPDTIWNLQKLRHLEIRRSGYFSGFRLPVENVDNFSDLSELDSLSSAILSSWDSMEKQMRKFPNIRKLRCIFEIGDSDGTCKKIMVPDFLRQLESLDLSTSKTVLQHIEFEFGYPEKLKKLTLQGFTLPWSRISPIGKLPNLEVLKLLDESFLGETWDMEEGEFSKLKYLKLSGLDIVKWTASDDLCLQKLVFDYCCELEEIPSCLENISTLEIIEVLHCSESVASLVQQIQEEQMDMGNSALKILIQGSDYSS